MNAALFRKSDFISAGGYNTAYNVALEDHDLWLNFIYRQNLKFYRVEKTLFMYRIKDKTESRNEQNRNQHLKIIEGFYTKYPKMLYYKNLSEMLKPVKKIGRFFFRIQNGYIRILKIPIWKIKKYDTVVSVGAACFVPETMKKLKLRDFSGPFDWVFGSDVITRLKFIKNKFKNYFNFEDFEYVGLNPDNGKAVYKNKRSGIVYNHDFPTGDFADVFPAVAEKYERRINRMIYHLQNDNHVLLVFFELNNIGNKEQIIKIMDEINKKYKARIDLLYVNHNPNIKLGKHKRIKRISDYVMYSEYHYDKYPDEIPYANKVCEKLIKKVSK